MLLGTCSASATWSPIHCEVNESKLNSSCLNKGLLHHVISNPHFNFMFRLSRHKISKFIHIIHHQQIIQTTSTLVAKTQTTHYLNLVTSISESRHRSSQSTKLIKQSVRSAKAFNLSHKSPTWRSTTAANDPKQSTTSSPLSTATTQNQPPLSKNTWPPNVKTNSSINTPTWPF